MKNRDFTEYDLVVAFVTTYLDRKRALPAWEIEQATHFDAARVDELFDGPRLQRDMIDSLGDGTYEPKPALLADIILAMRDADRPYRQALNAVLLAKFKPLDEKDNGGAQ
jgi:hypothetical protein